MGKSPAGGGSNESPGKGGSSDSDGDDPETKMNPEVFDKVQFWIEWPEPDTNQNLDWKGIHLRAVSTHQELGLQHSTTQCNLFNLQR